MSDFPSYKKHSLYKDIPFIITNTSNPPIIGPGTCLEMPELSKKEERMINLLEWVKNAIEHFDDIKQVEHIKNEIEANLKLIKGE